jgi:hypothetical protein
LSRKILIIPWKGLSGPEACVLRSILRNKGKYTRSVTHIKGLGGTGWGRLSRNIVIIKSGQLRCGPVQEFGPGSVEKRNQLETSKGKLRRCNSIRKISLLAIGRTVGEEEHELGRC